MKGERFGGFEVVDEIGRGWTGIVYRARQPSLDREVALKVFAPGAHWNKLLVEQLRADVRAASRTNHPNLVQVYDVGSRGELHYLAVEFVEGESLSAVIEREGPMGFLQAAAIASQVAAALDPLHAAGLLHGGLRPSNVLVASGGLAKVTDFGVGLLYAAMEQRASGEARLALAQCASPEQARGEELDGRSEVYAVGAMLHHMLTGQPPFRGETPEEVLAKHADQEPASVRRARSDVPDRLVEIAAKCLAKDRTERPQTAAALAGELDHVRLELEFAALSAETPGEGGRSLYPTQALRTLRLRRQAEKGALSRLLGVAWELVAPLWRFASGTVDRDALRLGRAAARMETALADVAEAKEKRAELRRRAEELHQRAAVARAESGQAFDAGQIARAEELVEEERRCDGAAVDYETSVESLGEAIATLERRYTTAGDEHERVRTKVELKAAQAILGRDARRAGEKRQIIKLVLAVVLVLAAVAAWRNHLAWARAEDERLYQKGFHWSRILELWDGVLDEPPQMVLHQAVIAGDLAAVKRLIEEHDFEVDVLPLSTAARVGHEDLVEYVLGLGADVNVASPLPWGTARTALHEAAAAGHQRVCRILLSAGADVNRADHLGTTPLHDASARGHVGVVSLLLASGAQADCSDAEGRTSLYLAAGAGHEHVVTALLAGGATVDACTRGGQTALHAAAASGQNEIVRLLLYEGAAAGVADERGRTALHYAAAAGRAHVVRFLLGGAAAFDVRDSAGATPLHDAARHGRLEVVEELIDAGAEVNARQADGRTALAVATAASHRDAAQILRDNGGIE